MGFKGITFFAIICLISATRGSSSNTIGKDAEEKIVYVWHIWVVIWSVVGTLVFVAFVWGCWRYCSINATNVTVISPSGGGGGGNPNQNSLVVNMPTQLGIPQPFAPMPQQPAPIPQQYTPMPQQSAPMYTKY